MGDTRESEWKKKIKEKWSPGTGNTRLDVTEGEKIMVTAIMNERCDLWEPRATSVCYAGRIRIKIQLEWISGIKFGRYMLCCFLAATCGWTNLQDFLLVCSFYLSNANGEYVSGKCCNDKISISPSKRVTFISVQI
jgi:hypothetical protein